MPAYTQIARQLGAEIHDGTHAAGTALPTIPELMERFGVSRITIRGALGELANQGLVYTGYGEGRRGTFVRASGRTDHYATDALKLGRKRSNYDAFSESAERAGRKPSKRFSMRIEVPPAEIAKRLGVGTDELVVVRSLHQLLDDEPWSTETSYFPRDLATKVGLDTPHDIPGGTIRALADAGFKEIAHVDEITDSVADDSDAADLGVPTGYPLLVQLRTGATADLVTRVTRYVRLGRRTRILWELGRDAGLAVIRDARDGREDQL
ncbi:MAG TPA: GntR family transcriptional regulator [Nocardioidaceae bacterium]|nr:GntR family transcriptional regulator [Nocardioidaceae bacterium]